MKRKREVAQIEGGTGETIAGRSVTGEFDSSSNELPHEDHPQMGIPAQDRDLRTSRPGPGLGRTP